MTDSRAVVRGCKRARAALSALALATGALMLGSDALAKPFDLSGSDWEGCADFVQIARDDLGSARVFVTSRLDMHELKREDAVVLIHPERTLDVESLAAFMRNGGRVVLLDDYGTGDALLRHFSIERVPLPDHPAEMLRNNPAFALAEPASAHPAVHDVAHVVTNHATGVRHPELSPVLKVRGASGDPDVLLAEAGAVNQGRFLAVGDSSIVINAMLRYPGNRAFARALLRYAVDDDTWGKRNGRIFIASNDFVQTGSFGEEQSAWDHVREWMRNVEDALETLRREGAPPPAAYLIAVAVGLAIVLWVGSRAGKLHKQTSPRFVRGAPLVAQGGVAGHAAVIAAPSTSRLLAMLELKSALEEDLCGMLDLEQMPGTEALLAKVRERGLLDPQQQRALQQLLLRMANVETMVIARQAGHSGGVRDREVVATAAAVQGILAAARARAHGASTLILEGRA